MHITGHFDGKQQWRSAVKRIIKKSAAITTNPNASRNYSIESRFETGIVLQGWEVKSLRKNRFDLKNGHARFIRNELWLLGAHIAPLSDCDQNSSKIIPDRTRKLLLKKHEINRLIGTVSRRGYTLVPVKAYWKRNFIKIEIGLGKGKRIHDKRASKQLHDWQRDKRRLLMKNKLD